MGMMARKFFPAPSSGTNQSDLSLVYRSVTESTLNPGLLAAPRGQYERIRNDGVSSSNSSFSGSSPSVTEENSRGFNGRKTVKLGGNSTGMASRTRVALISLLRAPSNFICKVKEQYALWKDCARRTNVRVTDLFVANQVFMHIQATPVSHRRKQQSLKPSVGFVIRVEVPSAVNQGEMRER